MCFERVHRCDAVGDDAMLELVCFLSSQWHSRLWKDACAYQLNAHHRRTVGKVIAASYVESMLYQVPRSLQIQVAGLLAKHHANFQMLSSPLFPVL